jgi:hypothetical protein
MEQGEWCRAATSRREPVERTDGGRACDRYCTALNVLVQGVYGHRRRKAQFKTDGIDHFIPGLAVNKATSGSGAQLGLTYYFFPSGSTQLSVGFISSSNAGSTWATAQTIASGMPTTWAATTSQGRMVGDYISTSYGSDNLAHGVLATAGAPSSGTSCSSTPDNCLEPTATFSAGLAAGSASAAADPVLFAGNGNANANSLWNVVDNNGSKHRD